MTITGWHGKAKLKPTTKGAAGIYYNCAVWMLLGRDLNFMTHDRSKPVDMSICAPIAVTVVKPNLPSSFWGIPFGSLFWLAYSFVAFAHNQQVPHLAFLGYGHYPF